MAAEPDAVLAKEVRLAMGWNGGVSLAVWMGGVAVELDCARRAHLGAEAAADHEGPREVYNAVCEAFSERLVPDLFAGASAGGLNSALLGAAMSRARRLHPEFLREKWLTLGDFDGLLQPTNASKPRSLMQGDKFKGAMDDAFAELMAVPPERGDKRCELPSGQVDTPFYAPLDIQVTNVMGQQHSFTDAWGRELVTHEYRAPFRFRASDDYAPRLLAAAARASASFPVAFEPFALEGDDLLLTGIRDLRPPVGRVGFSVSEPTRRYAIDGGLLENAPIRQAIDLIPLRHASGPVRRFVCYVNANPSSWGIEPPTPEPPQLRDMLGYVVNLPRTGRDIDQWNAIIDARRRGQENTDTLTALISLPTEALSSSATALLPSYRKRRACDGLAEILGGSGFRQNNEKVDAVVAVTNGGADLPWLPKTMTVPADAASWDWGFRAAERALSLQLDLLRGALAAAMSAPDSSVTPQARAATVATVYRVWGPIDAAIAMIERGYNAFVAEDGLAGQLEKLTAPPEFAPSDRDGILNLVSDMYHLHTGSALFDPLRNATAAFYGAVRSLVSSEAFPYPVANLFGTNEPGHGDEMPAAAFAAFLERALGIEVVRRAFVDDLLFDSTQVFEFAELGPNVPIQLLTATPFQATGPNTPEEKLCGRILAHFGGFYRSSWRANDFMWGRLDASARIIDFLIDLTWQQRLGPDAAPWNRLAETISPTTESSHYDGIRTLTHEALTDLKNNAEKLAEQEEVNETVGAYLSKIEIPAATDIEKLRDVTTETLKADLLGSDPARCGGVARVLLARAAQYEVLESELVPLAQATQADHKQGCFSEPFNWTPSDNTLKLINRLRADYANGNTLPDQLGLGSKDEASSELALRTISKTALVTLAALPGLAIPLSNLTKPGRIPFLATAGVVSKGWLGRLAVLLAFTAATLYLTGRVITADENPNKHPVYAADLISPPVWAMALAAIVVIGVLLVPASRTWSASTWQRHAGHGIWLLLLLLGSGVFAIAYAAFVKGEQSLALTGAGGFDPGKVKIAIAFAGAGLLLFGVRWLATAVGVLEPLSTKHTWIEPILAGAAAAFVVWWSARYTYDALTASSVTWHRIAAAFALVGIAALALYLFIRAAPTAPSRALERLTRR